MGRVVHFELGTVEPERAAEFYRMTFGWQVTRMPGPFEYWVVQTGDGMGIDGGILKHRDAQPRTVNTIQVDSVDEYARKIESSGGKVVVPKFAVPGLAWEAFCTDTEGNLFGIAEFDSSAK